MKTISTANAAKSIRKHWGELKPVTRRINSKKQYNRKSKHKTEEYAEFCC